MGHQEAGGGRLSLGLGHPVLPLESAYAPFLGLGFAEDTARKGEDGGGLEGGVLNWHSGFGWSLHLAKDSTRER